MGACIADEATFDSEVDISAWSTSRVLTFYDHSNKSRHAVIINMIESSNLALLNYCLDAISVGLNFSGDVCRGTVRSIQ
jgi:hypothetical protein